jgi:hypothetical protein
MGKSPEWKHDGVKERWNVQARRRAVKLAATALRSTSSTPSP